MSRSLVLALFPTVLTAALLIALPAGAGGTQRIVRHQNTIVFDASTDPFVTPTDVYSVLASGGVGKHLTKTPSADDSSPSWSANRRAIFFSSDRNGPADDIFKMKANGKKPRPVTSGPQTDFSVAAAPDGMHLAFTRVGASGGEIVVTDIHGRHPHKVTHLDADTFNARWSPDSRRIAFYSNDDGDFDVYRVGRNDRHLKQLTDEPGFDGDAVFSNDGKTVYFDSSRDGDSEIYSAGARDGANVKQLTDNDDADVGPALSPNGKRIGFVSDRSGSTEIWRMRRSGEQPRRVTTNSVEEFGIDW